MLKLRSNCLLPLMLAVSLTSSMARAASEAPKPGPGDNEQLFQLFVADQQDRQSPPGDPSFDWKAVAARDKERQSKLAEAISGGLVRTAADHVRAANILQHGESVDSIRLAFAMASIASYMDPSHKEARWLMAASWDRLMVRLERPQWYGTQFTRIGDTGPWTLGKVDERITDAERATYFVPPLSEMRKHLDEMNRAAPPDKK